MAVKGNENLFEYMVSQLTLNFMNSEDELVLDKKAGKLPGRLMVLAQGFAAGWNLEQINEALSENGYEVLYARSFYEAGLIYAFSHGLSYEEWRNLYSDYSGQYAEYVEKTTDRMWDGKITLKLLEEYVKSNSDENLATEAYTTFVETQIVESKTKEEFAAFMDGNLRFFSNVREKSRYYFCKYLYLYVQDRCEQYYRSCEHSEKQRLQYGNMLDKDERGHLEKFALEELSFLKPLTVLKKEAQKSKPSMSLAEKREYLENTALTPGGIFDEFNYFYFGYVSVDWMELVFELYGELDEWPEDMKIRIANSLGYCSANPGEVEKKKALQKLAEFEQKEMEKEEALDQDHDRDSGKIKKLYQRGRSGEDFFREFMTGKRDINRETLISFLLFIKAKIKLDDDNKITLARLNRIMDNCGFAQLRPDQEFDRFVLAYLRSKDPFSIVESHVEQQVAKGQDFYLYKVYKNAYCHKDELVTYLRFMSED